jgi:HTH-type transcriptional regulator / antitoxin HigA
MMNAAEYERALELLDEVFDAPEGSDSAKTRESLVDQIERYEDLHYPIDLPDLKGAIIARLDDLNLTPDDSFFTDPERRTIRALIAGTTEPSDHVVRVLLDKLGIPPEVMDGEGR